uniref:Kinesin motor domain-containing protein n=3 Tax=Amphimedon queenslandica TaxID=400682 RepID=A0A1X7UMF4_AMPQE
MDRHRRAMSVGITVKIKRSSGLVHDASVTGIDSLKGLVSVEWYESGETKGKEIDLDSLIQLNPQFANLMTPPTSATKASRRTNIAAGPLSGIPRPQGSVRLRNVENIISTKGSSKASPLSAAPPLPPPQEEQITSSRSDTKLPPAGGLPRSKSSGSLAVKPSDVPDVVIGGGGGGGGAFQGRGRTHTVVEEQVETGATGKGPSRKSNVVKEVDIIKKKREERRVKIAEKKQKRSEDYDPDNPNWQFAGMVRQYRSELDIIPIASYEPVIDDRICVCVRKRPLSKKELAKKEIDIITIPDGSLTLLHEPKTKVDLTKYLEHHKFNFDYSFDETADNELLYHYSAKSLVSTIFNQGMATCFAYGQTGSGKTHTMGGDFRGREQDATKGIYALAAADVFRLNRVTHESKDLVVSSSFFEIYCGKVYDLLNNKKKLRILEDAKSKVQIIDLEEVKVTSVADVLQLIETGNSVRTSGTTSANQNSSRSHAVFQLVLRKRTTNKLHGKLSLIDLAGNERGADTSSSDRQTRWEGAEINKSLLALKECIRALGKKSIHLPFRGSTLTKVLRDSFVGPRARTCMIATVSPGFSCSENSLNTLRYAERVKELPNKRQRGNEGGQVEQEVFPIVNRANSKEEEEEEYEYDEEEDDDNVMGGAGGRDDGYLARSDELKSFHETLSRLQQIEDQVIDEHREIIQEYRNAIDIEEALLSRAEGVEGDPDVYIQSLIKIVDEKMQKLSTFRDHLEDYSQRLREEEAAREFLLALLLAVYLLYVYSDIRRQNPVVTGSTLLIWFLSFVIIFLLPVDVSSAFFRLCLDPGGSTSRAYNFTDGVSEPCSTLYCTGKYTFDRNSNFTGVCESRQEECFLPYSFICKLPLEVLWYLIYWLFFLLSWIILPLIQSYVLAGYFTVWKKLLRALIENAIFYISLLVIVVILFIYVVLVKKLIALTELPYIIATASNTWGLIILAFLLGYGLVEVPRSLFNASRHNYTLNHCYFRAAKLYIDMAESNETLQELTEKFPSDTQSNFSRGHDDYEDYTPSEDALSKSSLEKLYKKVTKAIRLSNSTKIQWSSLAEQTLDLEDIETNKGSGSRIFKSSVRGKKKFFDHPFIRSIEWFWKVVFKRWVYIAIGILLSFLSLCIVWSQVVFSLPRFSIFALLVYASHQMGRYSAIEILSVLVVAYLSFCAYYTVFKIRIFNLYFLSPQHNTDEYSLLFSAVLLSRLALPICLNYLYIIQVVRLEHHEEDDQIPTTAFAEATGNTQLIPWLTSYAYWMYPVLILLVCIATLFSLGSRLASLLGYQKFMGEDDFSADYIDEGKALMKRERRLREKSVRECGRVLNKQLHEERLSEISSEDKDTMKKWREHRTKRINSLEEEEGHIDRLWGKAKGFASRKKVYLPKARFKSTGGGRSQDGEDDGDTLELLEEIPASRNGYRNTGGGGTGINRNKGIFDDL